MLHKLFERHTGPLTTGEFRELAALVTQDIQVNRVGFGKQTDLNYALQVAAVTHSLLMRNKSPAQATHRNSSYCVRALLKGVMSA